MQIKILNNEDNLASLLKGVRDTKVTIVSAFASGTEKVVDMLLDNKNTLKLLIGTINSFSSPNFFNHCKNKSIKDNQFSFFVDFGYQKSIHWKLYLIEPDIVIIGSANFTCTGLSLIRDTCVVIQDKKLLEGYIKELSAIKSLENVINSKNKKEQFEKALEKYKENHRRMQAGRLKSIKTVNADEWISDEESQLLPIFIWDSKHTKETIEEAHNLLKEELDEDPPSVLRDFFTCECDNKEDLPYKQGDIVLCMGSRGGYADFYSFDRIIHKDGCCYIYSYKQKHYTRPFILTKEIKDNIKEWLRDRCLEDEDEEITEIDREAIRKIIERK